MLHAGLDLSRKRLDVCLLSEDGELVEEFSAPPDADGLRGLVRHVGKHGVPVRGVIESMTGARFVHDTLEQLGWEVLIADAQKVKGLAPLACYPSAMAVIERDLPALVVHLRFPSEHRKRIRTTNLLERTFVEVRRRTKVIGRFPGETSALSLIWAVLELSSRGWRGVKMNPKTVAEIERLRRQLADGSTPPVTDDAEEVIAA
jgi:hypothetical protein